ncbi:MAG: 50S ribosomal protein L2 [Nanoarchaeota archaeon]|nr:50S ribosomal protein L2 [Nanoarchaeota archaeon]MBU1135270.1 50S ribosomal protein L2 [Nanoarchaeota archaeon]MBU2519880.1 50S ribosomal protein L2 [Nanoarchaeota archaeon]
MGKRIIAQRRGKGSSTYRVPEYSFKPKIIYNNQNGKVIDIVTDRIRNAPLAQIRYDDNTKGYIVAPEGIKVGDNTKDVVKTLSNITEGTRVFAIESYPNSGPKFCRTSGSTAIVMSKDKKECTIQFPSKKIKKINLKCRATIGLPAGEGRKEKPWVKAGKKWIAMHRRGKLYPITSATAMNAVDHPFGGGGIGKARPPASRNAPPGRKVGTIAPKRTGRRKRK